MDAMMEVDQSLVLGKAVQRSADRLGMNGPALSSTLGIDAATASRILRGEQGIEPTSKEGEFSLMLVRVFRALEALVNGDDAKRRRWLSSYNTELNGVPAMLILSVEGLARTQAYLDGMRATKCYF